MISTLWKAHERTGDGGYQELLLAYSKKVYELTEQRLLSEVLRLANVPRLKTCAPSQVP
jgi:hypothetical protein